MRKSDVLLREDSLLALSKEDATKSFVYTMRVRLEWQTKRGADEANMDRRGVTGALYPSAW
jgi:hypothetical protein